MRFTLVIVLAGLFLFLLSLKMLTPSSWLFDPEAIHEQMVVCSAFPQRPGCP